MKKFALLVVLILAALLILGCTRGGNYNYATGAWDHQKPSFLPIVSGTLWRIWGHITLNKFIFDGTRDPQINLW